jgi:hypothetical protein
LGNAAALKKGFASVLIPGGAINIVVRISRLVMSRSKFLHPVARKWFPTSAGIASIPFIVHPIDNFVDYSLDNSIRAWWRENGKK